VRLYLVLSLAFQFSRSLVMIPDPCFPHRSRSFLSILAYSAARMASHAKGARTASACLTAPASKRARPAQAPLGADALTASVRSICCEAVISKF
jgi:hypothetical protein